MPHTPHTEGLFDAARLARCAPTAVLVNVGRGPTVHLDALADVLQQGRLRLAGAALDVFDPQPLPADHPLWRRPDVLITPHAAGSARTPTNAASPCCSRTPADSPRDGI